MYADNDNLPDEEWRDVPSIPGLRASSHGRICLMPFERRMPHGGLRWYHPAPTFGVITRSSKDARHLYFIYRYGSLKRNIKIHFAVCEAFNGRNTDGNNGVRHLNENGLDNRPQNLRWSSQKVNLNDPDFISYTSRRPSPRTKSDKTKQEKRAGIYDSILDIAEMRQRIYSSRAANDNQPEVIANAA